MSGYENLGPNVSQNPQAVSPGGGNFSSSGRSYDTVVSQQNRPPMDWEWNLIQSIHSESLQNSVQNSTPSGFLTGDFLNTDLSEGLSGQTFGFLTPDVGIGANANKMTMLASNIVVNGWSIHLEFTETNTPGQNLLTFPVPPVAGTRQDLVILEVWRALISPAPSTLNKDPSGQIFIFGNAKAPDSFPPGNVNLADDLIDPNYLQESSRRVQIQYRLRIVSGADLASFPDGLGDPTIPAFTTPYNGGPTADGVATALPYVPHSTDPGLWVAGNGDAVSAAALGTVDGYMYAIPVFAIFRRNSGGFQRNSNLNGGVGMASPSSDRPDGLFADQIHPNDIIDLRKTSTLGTQEVFDKTFSAILKNRLTTNFDVSGFGPSGTTYTMRDSTGVGQHLQDLDGVRHSFSDRVVTKAIVTSSVQGAPFSNLSVGLNSLDLPWVSAVAVKAKAPVGTNITGVSKVHIVTATNDYDAFDPLSPYQVESISFVSAPGPEIDSVDIVFTGPVPASTCNVELLVEYPKSCGLSRNVTELKEIWVPALLPVWADPAQFNSTSDVDRLAIISNYTYLDESHREIGITYPTNSIVSVFRTLTTTTVMIPDMIDPSSVSIVGKVVVDVTADTAYTTITFNPPVASAGDPVNVTYVGLRPPPQASPAPNDTMDVFYETRARQSLTVPAGVQTLELIPRIIGSDMTIIIGGTANPGYTIVPRNKHPGTQIPISTIPAASFPESTLDNPLVFDTSVVKIDSINSIANPVVHKYDPDSTMQLYNDGTPTIDGDGRSFWPFVSATTEEGFIMAGAKMLSNSIRRKVVFPVLAELKADYPSYGRKGSMFLILYSKLIMSGSSNAAFMGAPPYSGDGCAAVYKLRGNPMNPVRS